MTHDLTVREREELKDLSRKKMKRNSKMRPEVSHIKLQDHHGCGGSGKLLETNKE